jgi:hypothetical protein
MTTHKYIKEAFQALLPDKFIIFHGSAYEEIEVTNGVKPSLADVIAKANEIEFNLFKEEYKNMAKEKESEARNKISGNASLVLIAHWNNQKIIAEKILNKTVTAEEQEAFEEEIKLRGKNETLEEFSKNVLDKSNIYTFKMCYITGAVKQCYIAIEKATTIEDMKNALSKLDELIQ